MMSRKITFSLLIIGLVLAPTNAIFFGWSLKNSLRNSRKLASYDSSKDINTNSFGFESHQQSGLSSGQIPLYYFVSGPQNMNTLSIKNEGSVYYEEAKYNKAQCSSGSLAGLTQLTQAGDEFSDANKCSGGDYCDGVGTSRSAFITSPSAFCVGENTPVTSYISDRYSAKDVSGLDAQCYSLTTQGTSTSEFDSITCEQIDTYGGEDTHNTYSTLDLNTFLGDTQAQGCDDTCSLIIYDNKVDCEAASGTWHESGTACRYPKQEYCLAEADKTLFTELFGCADDQRIACGSESCDLEGDDQTTNPCLCAGGIELSEVDNHANHVDINSWFINGQSKNFYGTGGSGLHVCSEPEIIVANELSAYMDKVDKDITTACTNAVNTFKTISDAYVNFIKPSGPLHLALTTAWKQAEFAERNKDTSAEILSIMKQYRKWTFKRLADIHSAPTHDDDVTKALLTTVASENYDTYEDAVSPAFKAFKNAWDAHIRQYTQLRTDEASDLNSDMSAITTAIAKAEAHARELAKTQRTAASAVATISVHFRKKLKIWLQIEETLEQALKGAISGEKALSGQKNRDHLAKSFAETHSISIPETDESGSYREAFIGSGSSYQSNRDSTHEVRIKSISTKSGTVDNKAQYTSSNDVITTSIACEDESDCDYSVNAESNYPLSSRTIKCENKLCVIEPSRPLADHANDIKKTTTVELNKITYAGDNQQELVTKPEDEPVAAQP